MTQLEQANAKLKVQQRDDQTSIEKLEERCREAERANELLTLSSQENEHLLEKLGEEIQQVEMRMERKSKEHE